MSHKNRAVAGLTTQRLASYIYHIIVTVKHHNGQAIRSRCYLLRETQFFTKVVALGLQFLDKKDKEEPVMTVEEDATDYEA